MISLLLSHQSLSFSFFYFLRFVAGVTNPMFQQMDNQWDLLCVLDLPNETCQVMSADEKRIEDAIAKGKPLPVKKSAPVPAVPPISPTDIDAEGGPTFVSQDNSLGTDALLTMHEQSDSVFYTRIMSGVNMNKFSEFWLLTQIRDYVKCILDQALDLKYSASDGDDQGQYDTTPEKRKTFREKARSFREKIRGSTSSSIEKLPDPTGTKAITASEAGTPGLIPAKESTESLSEQGSDQHDNGSEQGQTDSGWTLVRKVSPHTLSETYKKFFAANGYRAKVRDCVRECVRECVCV